MKTIKKCDPGFTQNVVKRNFPARVLQGLFKFLIRLDEISTSAQKTDDQIRNMRAEHYAKHGFYFRDRF